ncbi:hypothetical protein ISS04_01695 [Candidatus Woesearchaeota archaeon]|nr:hypothetical protein [Candidatus Woesearchaeota archaeon]
MGIDKEVKRLFIEGGGKIGIVESNKPGSDWYISYVGEKTRLKKLRELEVEREKGFEYVNSKFLNADYKGK